MRYWASERSRVSRGRKRSHSPRRSIASGGSIRNYPFLRRFYQHQAVISGGLQKFFFFLMLATLLYAFVLGDGGAIRIISLRHKRAALDRDIAQLKKNAELLEREIDHLKNDPFYMEKIGRERYGYFYPGEKVYKLVPRLDKTKRFEK